MLTIYLIIQLILGTALFTVPNFNSDLAVLQLILYSMKCV